MTLKQMRARIMKLKICRQAKESLLMLAKEMPRLVEQILIFLRRHRQFAEALLLGAIVAFLLTFIPGIGHFLALLTLVTAGAIGLMRDLMAPLAEAFRTA